MGQFEQAAARIDERAAGALLSLAPQWAEKITEIRMRLDRPLCVTAEGKNYFVSEKGELLLSPQNAFVVTREMMENTLFSLCDYSVQSRKEQLLQGYLPVDGGSRAGIAAAVRQKDGQLLSVGEVNAINLRVAFAGEAPLSPKITALFQKESPSVLVAGPPLSGKTTCLRSILSLLADTLHQTVAVVDERGEFFRPPGGVTADYLRFYPKAKAVDIAVRTLSPQLILCDEIGSPEDAEALLSAHYAGVKIIASAHGGSRLLLHRHPVIGKLLQEGVFDYILLLQKDPVGAVSGIFPGKE